MTKMIHNPNDEKIFTVNEIFNICNKIKTKEDHFKAWTKFSKYINEYTKNDIRCIEFMLNLYYPGDFVSLLPFKLNYKK